MLYLMITGSSDGKLFLKVGHHYWHQIQVQLHITSCQHCDLVVWTTVNVQVIEVMKDNSWAVIINKLIDFYFDVFIPAILE